MSKPKEPITQQDLNKILDKINADSKTEGLLLVNQLSFIIDTLDKLKELVNQNGVLEDFKQGKQEFIRESQALKSYNTTMKTYNTTLTNLLKLVNDSQKQVNEDKRSESDATMMQYFKWYNREQERLTKDYMDIYKIKNDDDIDYDKVQAYAKDIYNREYNTKITMEDIYSTSLLYEEF